MLIRLQRLNDDGNSTIGAMYIAELNSKISGG